MKVKLYIILAAICISLSSLAQQRSYCDIVPLHLGKYPIFGIAKHADGKLSPMFVPDSVSYIEVKPTELNIVVSNKQRHNFQYTSIPRSGIDYFLLDNTIEEDVPVFIFYTKDDKTKDKYFGIFVRYNENIEWVFTYKAGTQIAE